VEKVDSTLLFPLPKISIKTEGIQRFSGSHLAEKTTRVRKLRLLTDTQLMKKILFCLSLLVTVYGKADTTTLYVTSIQQPFQSVSISGCDTLRLVNTSGYSLLVAPDTTQFGGVNFSTMYMPDTSYNSASPQQTTAFFYHPGSYDTLFIGHQVQPFFYTIIITTCTFQQVNICEGESYVFDGATLTASGTYTAELQAANGSDSTSMLQLYVQPPSLITLNETICAGGAYLFNGQSLTAPGTYTGEFQTVNGCDSTVTLNLQVNAQPDIVVTEENNSLISAAASASWSWLDCSNNYLPTGVTTASYTPSENGQYAVQVTQNGCTDTSDCFAITTLTLDEAVLTNTLSICPVPATDQVTIVSSGPLSGDYCVFDLTGMCVLKGKLTDHTVISIGELASGVYYVRMNEERMVKMVKE